MSRKYLFKFIVIGDSGVGKSCLLLKFTDNRFRPDHDLTIGVEFGSKEVNLSGETVHLQVWDTAGQESFRSITRAYYKGATAALLVYDISRRSSFKSLEDWTQEVKDNANLNIVTVLVGNKSDIETRQVSTEDGLQFAQERGMMFIETSARTGLNVDEAFMNAANEVMNRVQRGEISLESSLNTLRNQPQPKKKGCCGN